MLSAEPVKSRVGELAIGLAIDCDNASREIYDFVHEKLPDASTLPFVGLLTPEGEWIDGYSGYRDGAAVLKFLEAAAKSPLLAATADVREKLRELVADLDKAMAKERWNEVLELTRKAVELPGRCPEREQVAAAEGKLRAWVKEQFDSVLRDAAAGENLADAKRRLVKVRKLFEGEPEAQTADRGVDAIRELNFLRRIRKRGTPKEGLVEGLREQFAGTPWVAMFDDPRQADEAAPEAGRRKAAGG